LSIYSFSYLDKSCEAMKAYVACLSFEEALKFFKLFNAPIAVSLSRLDIIESWAYFNHGCSSAFSADGLAF